MTITSGHRIVRVESRESNNQWVYLSSALEGTVAEFGLPVREQVSVILVLIVLSTRYGTLGKTWCVFPASQDRLRCARTEKRHSATDPPRAFSI
jgi:hypothetical protein